MENWLGENWSQLLTVALLIGSWVYTMGKVVTRIDTLEKRVISNETFSGKTDEKLASHGLNHGIHITTAFTKMLDDRHQSMRADIIDVKEGIGRIERFLMGDKK